MLNKRIQQIAMPRRLKKLKISSQGYPVPWFVPWVNNELEFRALDAGKLKEAWLCKKCWVCGETLGKFYAFVIGPMCMLNRINSEPPSHHECAQYAVQACPFLSPGVAVIWTTTKYVPFNADNGVLFRLGDPASVEFWREGRRATRAEVLAAIDAGLPALREVAEQEGSTDKLMARYETAIRRAPQEEELISCE
jgi:hypothetical protein